MPTTDLDLVAGSLCNNQKRPCRNTPTAPQALLKAARLEPIFSIDLKTDPTANGAGRLGRSRGEMHMG